MQIMKRVVVWILLGCAWGLMGCAPKEPPAPEPDESLMWREQYFGDLSAVTGIQWRSSGLGIRVLVPGEGVAPQLTDRVRVFYVGRLKDGTVFDESHARASGKPADFQVSQLITGWAASMPSLKPGGQAEFYIPPHLGYGGLRSGKIPAHAGLIFEVELLAVNPEIPAKK